jgi:hypothetical protein
MISSIFFWDQCVDFPFDDSSLFVVIFWEYYTVKMCEVGCLKCIRIIYMLLLDLVLL